MLIEYVRKGKYHSKKKTNNRIKKGVLVAVVCDDDVVRIGWSLCKYSSGDKFTTRGLKIAMERATRCTTTIPHSVKIQLNDFIERAQKYYKNKEVVSNILMPGPPLTVEELVSSIHEAFDFNEEDNKF